MSTNAAVLQYAESVPDNRPRCPVCSVPMWLVKIQHQFLGQPRLSRHHFECAACEAVAILPALVD